MLLWRGAFEQKQLSQRENLVLVAFSFLYTINIAVSKVSLGLVTVPVSYSGYHIRYLLLIFGYCLSSIKSCVPRLRYLQ